MEGGCFYGNSVLCTAAGHAVGPLCIGIRSAALITKPAERLLRRFFLQIGIYRAEQSLDFPQEMKRLSPCGDAIFTKLPDAQWGATRPPPVAEKGRGASGSGRQDASPLCRAEHLPGTATGRPYGLSVCKTHRQTEICPIFFFTKIDIMPVLTALYSDLLRSHLPSIAAAVRSAGRRCQNLWEADF